MRRKETPFLMAVPIAIFCLIWAQLTAPTYLKPLTNHLFDYPSAGLPAIKLDRGIFVSSRDTAPTTSPLSLYVKNTVASLLPKPIEIMCAANKGYCQQINANQKERGGYAGGGSGKNSDKEKNPESAAAKAQIAREAASVAAQPTQTQTGQTDNAASESQSPDYIARYGNCIGCLGYKYTNSKGEVTGIAGYTKDESGNYRLLAIADTKNEAKTQANFVATQVSTMTKEETASYLEKSSIVDQSIKEEILTTQAANQSYTKTLIPSTTTTNNQDGTTLQTTIFTDPATGKTVGDPQTITYKSEISQTIERDPDLGTIYHDTIIYRDATTGKIIDVSTVSYLNETTNRTFKTAGRGSGGTVETATISTTTQRDPNSKILLQQTQVYQQTSANTPDSAFISQRNTVSNQDGTTTATVKQTNYFNEKQAAARFADPKVETSTLAKYYCGKDDHGCVRDFSRTDYLSKLTDPSLVAQAKANYQKNLIDLAITLADPSSLSKLPYTSQNSIKLTNEKLQQAYQVYLQENKSRQHSSDITFEELALELGNKLDENPSLLDEYVAKYQKNPSEYNLYTTSGTVFNYQSLRTPSAVTVAKVESIRQGAPILGLFEKGALLPYSELSETYKNQVRDTACSQVSDSTYSLCLKRDQMKSGGSPQDLQAIEQALDALIKDQAPSIMQGIVDQIKGNNIKFDFYYGNLATIDNPNISSELRDSALTEAVALYDQKALDEALRYSKPGEKLKLTASSEQNLSPEVIKYANEYLDRQLVTETYNMGGGVITGAAGFGLGMGICAATGVGIAVSPLCGAIGGLIGWGASQIPLYQMTAAEYQAHQANVSDNRLMASIITSLYSNQGAGGDEGLGRSITTRDNEFALLQSIAQTVGTTPLSTVASNLGLSSNLAIQGQSLNNWETFQNRQEAWTWASAPIAAATGAINVGVGSSLATSFTNRAVTKGGYLALKVAADTTLFAGSTTLNAVQAYTQFESTSGDQRLLTTQSQQDYQACVYSRGSDMCGSELAAMNIETSDSRKFALTQAFTTDLLMQTYQTAFSFRGNLNEFNTIKSQASQIGIPIEGRLIGDIQADLARINKVATTLNIHPDDQKLLTDPARLALLSGEINSQTKILNNDLKIIKDNALSPTRDDNGLFRIQIKDDASADAPTRVAIERLNRLAEDIELANGHPLTEEQANILYTEPNIEQSVKAVSPGGGKTSYITLVELAKNDKSVYSAANATDALDALNTMLKSESGREYAKKRLGEVYYVKEDGTIIRINLDKASFDPGNICLTSKPALIPLAHAACSNEPGNIISATDFDAKLADPDSMISIFASHNGLGWEGQKGGWGQKILEGKYDSKFHIIADEAAKDALGSLAISGDPEKITSFKEGRNTLATLENILELDSLNSVIGQRLENIKDPSVQSPIVKIIGQEKFALTDQSASAKLLSDIAQSSITKIESDQKSLWYRFFGEKPNAKDLADLKILAADLNAAAISGDETAIAKAQGDFNTYLKRTGNSVIDAVSSRHTLVDDIINQLGLNENSFGLDPKNNKTLALFEAKGETGKTYSSIGQQLVLYEIGKRMLSASGVDISNLPRSSDLTISVTKSQTTLNAWYQNIYRSGNTIAFLDGTPDPLVHLGLGGMQGKVVDLPIDSARKLSNYGSETDFTSRFNENVSAESSKTHLLVLGDTQLGFDSLTNQIRSSNPNREVLIAQYSQGGEEFIHFDKGIAGEKTVYKTKAEFESKLHELATSRPGDALVIVQGRDRALDISVETDFLNMRWHNDLPRESIGTTSVQDAATQGIYRDRVFVDRISSDLINKVAAEKSISLAEAEILVNQAKKYHLYTHDSLGITSLDQVVVKLASQHAEHLNNLRLQATLTMLGDSQKNAIAILESHGRDLGLSENKTFKSFIESGLAEGDRLQDVYKREAASKPLTNANEIALEVFTRGKREYDRLSLLFEEVQKKFNLNSEQANQLKLEWGIDQEYVSFEEFAKLLNEPTTNITPRDFSTSMSTPSQEVLYWAKNSSTNPSSPAEYRVPSEAYIHTTVDNAPRTAQAVPAQTTSTTTPNLVTRILNRVKSWFSSSPTTTNQVDSAPRNNSLALTPTTRAELASSPIISYFNQFIPRFNQTSATLRVVTEAERELTAAQNYYNNELTNNGLVTTETEAALTAAKAKLADARATHLTAPLTLSTSPTNLGRSLADSLLNRQSTEPPPIQDQTTETISTPKQLEIEPDWNKSSLVNSNEKKISLDNSGDAKVISPTIKLKQYPGKKPILLLLDALTPPQSLITINGKTTKYDNQGISLDYGDIVTFGDITIKIGQDTSDRYVKRTSIEWAITPDSINDLASQQSNLEKLVFTPATNIFQRPARTKRINEALSTLRTNLDTRYRTIRTLHNLLDAKLSTNPTRDEMLNYTLAQVQRPEYKLTHAEINNLLFSINALMNQHEKVESLRNNTQDYPDEAAMWEAAFGFKPQGRIQIKYSYSTINFISSDHTDFARAYKTKGNIATQQPVQLTEDEINTVIAKVGGFHKNDSSRIPGTENIINVDRDDQNLADTIPHEDQHGLFTVIQLALAPNIRNQNTQVDQDGLIKEIETLYSKLDPSTTTIPRQDLRLLNLTEQEQNQFNTAVNKKLPTYIVRDNEIIFYNVLVGESPIYIYRGKDISRFTSLVARLSVNQRLEAENHVANEVLAQIAGNISAQVPWSTAKNDVISSLQHSNYTYFVDAALNRFTSIFRNLPDSAAGLLLQYQPLSAYTFDKFYTADAQNDLVKQAVDAYEILIAKGWKHSAATTFLQMARLSEWRTNARRAPILNVAAAIPLDIDPSAKIFIYTNSHTKSDGIEVKTSEALRNVIKYQFDNPHTQSFTQPDGSTKKFDNFIKSLTLQYTDQDGETKYVSYTSTPTTSITNTVFTTIEKPKKVATKYDDYPIDYSKPIQITYTINGETTEETINVSNPKSLNDYYEHLPAGNITYYSIRFTDHLGLSEIRHIEGVPTLGTSVAPAPLSTSTNKYDLPKDINPEKNIAIQVEGNLYQNRYHELQDIDQLYELIDQAFDDNPDTQNIVLEYQAIDGLIHLLTYDRPSSNPTQSQAKSFLPSFSEQGQIGIPTQSTNGPCSYCQRDFARPINSAGLATKVSEINAAILLHHNHTYNNQVFQDIGTAALFARKGKLTNNQVDYKEALKYLARAQVNFSNMTRPAPGSDPVQYDQKSLAEYEDVIRQLLESIPVPDSPAVTNFDNYPLIMEAAAAYLSNQLSITKSSIIATLSNTTLSALLPINRWWGDTQNRLFNFDFGNFSNTDLSGSNAIPANSTLILSAIEKYESKKTTELSRGKYGVTHKLSIEGKDYVMKILVASDRNPITTENELDFMRDYGGKASLPTYFGSGKVHDTTFYLMEYIDGETLESIESELRFENLTKTIADLTKMSTENQEEYDRLVERYFPGSFGALPIDLAKAITQDYIPRYLTAKQAQDYIDNVKRFHTETGRAHLDMKSSNLMLDRNNNAIRIIDPNFEKEFRTEQTFEVELESAYKWVKLRCLEPEKLVLPVASTPSNLAPDAIGQDVDAPLTFTELPANRGIGLNLNIQGINWFYDTFIDPVVRRYNSYLLDQWTANTKSQLTPAQQADILSRISAEPNGQDLQSTLVKSTTGLGNIFSNNTIPNDQKVTTYVQIIELAQLLSQSNPHLDITELITRLISNTSNLDIDTILTSPELLINLAQSINDSRILVKVLVAISGSSYDDIDLLIPDLITVISSLSKYGISAEEVLTLIDEPLTVANIDIVKNNITTLELITHRALAHPPFSQPMITPYALMASLHTVIKSDDPSTTLINIYNNFDRLLSLAKTYKNGNKYDYRSDFIAAGIQSPDIYQFLSVFTSPTFNRNRERILEKFYLIRTYSQKKGRLLLIPALTFIGTIQDQSQILSVVEQLNSIASIVKGTSIESTSALTDFTHILSISNQENIADIAILFESTSYRFGSQTWIQRVASIYDAYNDKSQVVALIKDISSLEQREIVLGLAAENPSNTQELVNAVNDLTFKHQASIANLVVLKEGYPGLKQNEIIRLAKALNTLDSTFSMSWTHISSQNLIQDLLSQPGSLQLIEHIAANHALYLTVFDQHEDVDIRKATITQLMGSKDPSSGIVKFRATQLKNAMANNNVTVPIPTNLNPQDSYILTSELNAYPNNNKYATENELLTTIENTLRHFFPTASDEYINVMSNHARSDSEYLVYLITYRQEIQPIISNPDYNAVLAENLIRRTFDKATANKHIIWKNGDVSKLITQVEQYLNSALPRTLEKMDMFQVDLFTFLVNENFDELLPKAARIYGEGFLSFKEHDYLGQTSVLTFIKNFQIPKGDYSSEHKTALVTEFIADNLGLKHAVEYVTLHTTSGNIESLLPYFTGYHKSFWETYLVYPTFGHFVANQYYEGFAAWKYFKEKIGADRSPDQVKILMLTLARNSKAKDVIWAQFRQRNNRLDAYLQKSDTHAPHTFLTPEIRAFWDAYDSYSFLRYRLNETDGFDYYIKYLYNLPSTKQLHETFIIEQTNFGNAHKLWDNAQVIIKDSLDSLDSGLPENIYNFWIAYKNAEYFSPRDFLAKNIDKINTYWQPGPEFKFTGTLTAKFYFDFAQADPIEFITHFTRKELSLAIGDTATQALLKSLPSGQTDEARNAFTHNQYDRATDFFASLITNPISHFTFTPQNMEIVTAYITQFGLSKTPALYNYYEQLYLFEKGELKELTQDLVDSKITSLSDLQARFESTKNQLFSPIPITNLENLSPVEIEIISLLTNHSVHRWTVYPITDIVKNYENDLDTQKINAETTHTTSVAQVPIVNYENNDFSSSTDSYTQMTQEILASLDNPEDITNLKNQMLAIFDTKLADQKRILTEPNIPEGKARGIQKQVQEVEVSREKAEKAGAIDELVNVILTMNVRSMGQNEQDIRSIFRQLTLKKLFVYRQRSPEYVGEVRNTLSKPVSVQSLSEIINIIDNRIKDHVLNIKQNNEDNYWTPETFDLLKANKKVNYINDYFLSHLNPLRETLASLKMSETKQILSIEMIPDKGIIGEMAGYCGGVCYTKVFPLLSTYPNVTPYKFVTTDPITGNKELIGSALVFEVKLANGEKAYVIRAFDVRDEANMDIGAFFEKFADHLAAIGQTNDISKVLVAGTGGTVSNYPITTQYVLGKYVNGKTNTPLKEKFNFNDYDITNHIFEVRNIDSWISILPNPIRIILNTQMIFSQPATQLSPSRPSLPALPALALGGGTSLAHSLIYDTFQFVSSGWQGLLAHPESRTTITNLIIYTKTWFTANISRLFNFPTLLSSPSGYFPASQQGANFINSFSLRKIIEFGIILGSSIIITTGMFFYSIFSINPNIPTTNTPTQTIQIEAKTTDVISNFLRESPETVQFIEEHEGSWLYNESNPDSSTALAEELEIELAAKPLILNNWSYIKNLEEVPNSPADFTLQLGVSGTATSPKIIFVDVDHIPGWTWDTTNYNYKLSNDKPNSNNSYQYMQKVFFTKNAGKSIKLSDDITLEMPTKLPWNPAQEKILSLGDNQDLYEMYQNAPIGLPTQYQIEVKTPNGKSFKIDLSNVYPTSIRINGIEKENLPSWITEKKTVELALSGDGTRLTVNGMYRDPDDKSPHFHNMDTVRINDASGTIQAPDTIEGKYVAVQYIEIDDIRYEVIFIIDRQQTYTGITTHVRELPNPTPPTSPTVPAIFPTLALPTLSFSAGLSTWAYNAAMSVTAPLAPYLAPIAITPELRNSITNLIIYTKTWVTANFKQPAWLQNIQNLLPTNFTFIPFGMSVATPNSQLEPQAPQALVTSDDYYSALRKLISQAESDPTGFEERRQKLNIQKSNEVIEKIMNGEMDNLSSAEAFEAIHKIFSLTDNPEETILLRINPGMIFSDNVSDVIHDLVQENVVDKQTGFRRVQISSIKPILGTDDLTAWGAKAKDVKRLSVELFSEIDHILQLLKVDKDGKIRGVNSTTAKNISVDASTILNMIHPLIDANGRSTTYWQVWLEKKLLAPTKIDELQIWQISALRPTLPTYRFDGQTQDIFQIDTEIRNQKNLIQGQINRFKKGEEECRYPRLKPRHLMDFQTC